jgi:hypothetical protein
VSDIKVGDLVMVVRWPHPCFGPYNKTIFQVEEIGTSAFCWKCHCVIKEPVAIYTPNCSGGPGGVPLSWLKRIDPPAVPESVERDTELTV